eukprot:36963-Chlamydomonas_euryale.AAC.1
MCPRRRRAGRGGLGLCGCARWGHCVCMQRGQRFMGVCDCGCMLAGGQFVCGVGPLRLHAARAVCWRGGATAAACGQGQLVRG